MFVSWRKKKISVFTIKAIKIILILQQIRNLIAIIVHFSLAIANTSLLPDTEKRHNRPTHVGALRKKSICPRMSP